MRFRVTYLLALSVSLSCGPDNVAAPRLSVPGLSKDLIVYPNPSTQDTYLRGVNYFVGFVNGTPSCPYPLSQSDCQRSWSEIQSFNVGKKYPRQPFLGWYNDSLQTTTNAQILAMVDAGYRYVIYQMDWSHLKYKHQPPGNFNAYTITNHMTSPYASKLKFTVSWADVNSNPDKICSGCETSIYWNDLMYGWTADNVRSDYSALFTLWFRDYATNPNFYRYNGRPVVFFLDPQDLTTPKRINSSNPSATELIALLRTVAAQYGFSGATTPFVVGQSVADNYIDSIAVWGFNASTGYVYETGLVSNIDTVGYNFQRIGSPTNGADSTYKWKWTQLIAKTDTIRRIRRTNPEFEYWVPNSSGRDSRPWSGHYDWTATASQFETHVAASMSKANSNSAITGRNLVSCCWNEWGEGAYVEPSTMDYNYSYRGSALSDANRRTVLGQAAGSNRMPGGWFDQIAGGYADGWGVDPDTPNQPIYVAFFKNDYYPNGVFLGQILENYYRGDINSAYGLEGVHGFHFQLPASACNSYIYVQFIDSSGDDQNPHQGPARYYAC